MAVIGTRDALALYQKEERNPVSEKIFRQILAGFHLFIVNKVIDGEAFRLPEKLGEIKIVGTKLKPKIDPITGDVIGLPVDWKSTLELWKTCPECKENKQRVFHLNEHTDGVRFNIRWSKVGVFIKNKDFYNFKSARSFRHLLIDAINKGKEYFVEF